MATSDWINLIAAILVGGGTLFLGIMAWRTIRQTRAIQTAEKREGLLDEIIKWAEDIKSASLTPALSAGEKEREVNILLRYGVSLSKATSIETIIGEKFQNELLVDFTNVLDNLLRFMCIRQLMFLGTLPTEEGFPKDILDEIKNEINKKAIKDLFTGYAEKSTISVNKLLRKANKIKIELLK